MTKVMVSCTNGAGSSLIIKIRLEQICKNAGIDVSINHYPVVQGVEMAKDYDVIVTSNNFVKEFESKRKQDAIVIGLEDIMSETELHDSFLKVMTKAN